MTRKIPFWITVLTGLFAIRFTTLPMSSFGWYHGGNEAVYSEIAYGLIHGNHWVPVFQGKPFFDTGPLTSYLIAGSFYANGVSEASARLPEILAFPVLCWGAWMCGENFFGKGRGKVAALLVGSSPFVLLWFGRAQTDAWMTAGILLFLAGFSAPESKKSALLIVGGLVIGILSKQPALMLVPFALMICALQARKSQDKWKSEGFHKGVLIFLGSTLGLLWYWVMFHFFPTEVTLGLRNRPTSIGENAPWSAFAIFAGTGALLFFSWLQPKGENWSMRDNKTILLFGILGYAIFGIFDAPVGHEYYILPLVAILGVFAAGWKWDNTKLATCVVVSLLITVPILAWAGDLDDRQTLEMGNFLEKLPSNATISAPSRLVYALQIYSAGRNVTKLENQNMSKETWVVVWEGTPEANHVSWGRSCALAAQTDRTFVHSPLLLYLCEPGGPSK